MATTNVSIRMDTELKAQADELFAELGMNLSTAFNIFVRQSLREGGIPFEIRTDRPNKETIAAMLEAENIAKDPNVKGYTDLDEMFADHDIAQEDQPAVLHAGHMDDGVGDQDPHQQHQAEIQQKALGNGFIHHKIPLSWLDWKAMLSL